MQGRNNGLIATNWRIEMLRKVTLGLIAAASLGAAALAPSAASAHGFHGGWHHGWGPGGFCFWGALRQTRRRGFRPWFSWRLASWLGPWRLRLRRHLRQHRRQRLLPAAVHSDPSRRAPA